jgi:hypothetical protein
MTGCRKQTCHFTTRSNRITTKATSFLLVVVGLLLRPHHSCWLSSVYYSAGFIDRFVAFLSGTRSFTLHFTIQNLATKSKDVALRESSRCSWSDSSCNDASVLVLVLLLSQATQFLPELNSMLGRGTDAPPHCLLRKRRLYYVRDSCAQPWREQYCTRKKIEMGMCLHTKRKPPPTSKNTTTS